MFLKTKCLPGLVALVFACLCDEGLAAPLANPGDFAMASIFTGTATNTSGGNPNADGQGWYRRDLTTNLLYYSNPKWATAVTNPGVNGSYAEVTNVSANKLRIYDIYYGQAGVGWVYTNQTVGLYVISCTNITSEWHLFSEFVVKTNDNAPYVSLSGTNTGNVATGVAYTNWLGRGGILAFRAWNNNGSTAAGWGTVSDLKVSLLAVATNIPAVTLSASTLSFPESPLQGTAVVTVALSQFTTSDVTINLGFSGTAAKGSDYTASATQVVIQAGESSSSITLAAIDNTVNDGNKTVTVTIDSLVNATNGTPTSVTLTRVDDEIPLAHVGDVLKASLFLGAATNTSGADPSLSGQGWYRKDLTTLLSYYTNPVTKWATSAVNPGNPSAYSEVTNVVADTFRVYDEYAGPAGVAWVYANQVVGRYVISCTNITSQNQFYSEFLVRTNASAPYVSLSGTNTGSVATGGTYTNWLLNGGKLAFRTWNNNFTGSSGRGTFSGLTVTLIEVPTNTPAVTLSSSSGTFPENPLQGSAVVTVTLSQFAASNVTVNLGFSGAAAKDTDYTASATQLVIQAGDTSGSITLAGIDNAVYDGSKTVAVTVDSLMNATNGMPTSVTLTRTDDEAPLVQDGDFVNAWLFAGTVTNTSGGNPYSSGQGWYRKDLTTLLNYYTNPVVKWATSAANTGNPYSEVTNVVADTFRIYDEYPGPAGVAWVYTNQVVGQYAISCTNITSLWQFYSEFLVKTSASASYVSLSGVNTGSVALGASYTNWLMRGGKFAFRGWDNNGTGASGRGTISGLKVTLIHVPTTMPAATLSSTLVALPENPALGTAVVTVALSQFIASNVTINLGFSGTAAKGTDYTASATQLVIQAGDTSGSITVSSIDNNVFDGHKTITISLDTLVNATNGMPASVTLTRVDDEAPLMQSGDSLMALVFPGSATNTSGGNPRTDGQGWYRKDMATLLNYYTNPVTKWATALTDPGSTYSEVTNVAAGKLRIYDEYYAQAGVAWVYSNQVAGQYAISCTNITFGWQFYSEFLVKTNASTPYVSLSGTNTGSVATGVAYTNWLGRGGRVAFRAWDNNGTAAAGWGTISDLKVTLLAVATNIPAVTLSASTPSFPENPVQGTAVVTVALSQFSTSDVTINLGFSGTAVKDTDYTASATQVVIQAGDSSGSITLAGIDNAVYDGNKTVTVTIDSLVNGANGVPTSVTLIRTDDEVPLLQTGDVVMASVFLGTGTNTSAGNPNPSGQGWWRKDLTTKLNYYTDSTQRWATAATTPVGFGSYSEVVPVASNVLRITDYYSGQWGVGWTYTNGAAGLYAARRKCVISCTNITGNSYFCSQFLLKSNASSAWVALSAITTGSVVNGAAYTNWLEHGGQLAFKAWESGSAAANGVGTVSDLKVTLMDIVLSPGTIYLFR